MTSRANCIVTDSESETIPTKKAGNQLHLFHKIHLPTSDTNTCFCRSKVQAHQTLWRPPCRGSKTTGQTPAATAQTMPREKPPHELHDVPPKLRQQTPGPVETVQRMTNKTHRPVVAPRPSHAPSHTCFTSKKKEHRRCS
jgi:hypothetical protein